MIIKHWKRYDHAWHQISLLEPGVTQHIKKYQSKSLRKNKAAFYSPQFDFHFSLGLMSDLQTEKKVWSYMTPNVLPEISCH